jgi:hypothetical protein
MVAPSFPWLFMFMLTLISGGASFYYGAVLSGLYKDSLMGRFRAYGDERRAYPVCRFLEAIGFWCLTLTFMSRALITQSGTYFQTSFVPTILFLLALMAFVTSMVARRRPEIRESLPRWYFDLLHISTREERRFIGWAWMKIPRKMRWRLNGDQTAFRVWADMVRLTVIYGARDPDDPWAVWG